MYGYTACSHMFLFVRKSRSHSTRIGDRFRQRHQQFYTLVHEPDMAEPFGDLDEVAPLPSPLQPQPISQLSTPTHTPTQGDYDKGRLPHPRAASKPPVDAQWERSQEQEKEREANIDKFAVLFSPSTPRASPVLQPATLPPSTEPGPSSTSAPLFDHPTRSSQPSRPPPRPHNPPSRPSSIVSTSSSDFGSFVGVSPTDDPLSAGFAVETSRPVSTRGDRTPHPQCEAFSRIVGTYLNVVYSSITTNVFFCDTVFGNTTYPIFIGPIDLWSQLLRYLHTRRKATVLSST